MVVNQTRDGQALQLAGGTTIFFIRNTRGLISLAQFGVIEFHPWGSRMPRPEKPDQLIWDLDPDPAVPWPEVFSDAPPDRVPFSPASIFPRPMQEVRGLRSAESPEENAAASPSGRVRLEPALFRFEVVGPDRFT